MMPGFGGGFVTGPDRAGRMGTYARTLMSWLPPALRESEDYMAVVIPIARELERLEESIELVRDQFFPQRATVLLWAWERIAQTVEEPAGVSVGERQDVVVSRLHRGRGDKLGAGWEARIERITGPGWSYDEHDPDDGAGPPAGVVWITVPFAPGSDQIEVARVLIRAVTPAHLDIVLASAEGFAWDASHWDEEAFGG